MCEANGYKISIIRIAKKVGFLTLNMNKINFIAETRNIVIFLNFSMSSSYRYFFIKIPAKKEGKIIGAQFEINAILNLF
ncbi:hypothetical protein JCM21531_3882 [Acetivibrio straminisolvens JCM 21531]|uniref:Uncharacterized protein n=1 Tax=Acetivibrio straminisolvens JCM 21531 TaxID=1294263 RepID=W4VAR4_9FIRM|nr:hypothetical protein JCM21531_3882 [Acetivibrio straminisolvens JCM 21531]